MRSVRVPLHGGGAIEFERAALPGVRGVLISAATFSAAEQTFLGADRIRALIGGLSWPASGGSLGSEATSRP